MSTNLKPWLPNRSASVTYVGVPAIPLPDPLPSLHSAPVKVAMLKETDSFGELELLYSQPRQATVRAVSEVVVCWLLDRDTYRKVMQGISMRKRKMYGQFLSNIGFLQSLTSAERVQLADALRPANFAAGDLLIQYGEEGQWFYIIVEGAVEVIGRDAAGNAVHVCEFGVGDCVGELEFIYNHRTVADVRATTPEVRTAKLNRPHFELCMGPVVDVLKRNAGAENATYDYYNQTTRTPLPKPHHLSAECQAQGSLDARVVDEDKAKLQQKLQQTLDEADALRQDLRAKQELLQREIELQRASHRTATESLKGLQEALRDQAARFEADKQALRTRYEGEIERLRALVAVYEGHMGPVRPGGVAAGGSPGRTASPTAPPQAEPTPPKGVAPAAAAPESRAPVAAAAKEGAAPPQGPRPQSGAEPGARPGGAPPPQPQRYGGAPMAGGRPQPSEARHLRTPQSKWMPCSASAGATPTSPALGAHSPVSIPGSSLPSCPSRPSPSYRYTQYAAAGPPLPQTPSRGGSPDASYRTPPARPNGRPAGPSSPGPRPY